MLPTAPPAARELAPDVELLSLADAIAYGEWHRSIELDVWGSQEQSPWKWSWLPIARSKYPLVVDCAVAIDEPAPARSYMPEDPEGGEPGAESLGDLVLALLQMYDAGAWTYRSNAWEFNWELVPDDLSDRGLF